MRAREHKQLLDLSKKNSKDYTVGERKFLQRFLPQLLENLATFTILRIANHSAAKVGAPYTMQIQKAAILEGVQNDLYTLLGSASVPRAWDSNLVSHAQFMCSVVYTFSDYQIDPSKASFVIAILIASKVNINAINPCDGKTALHVAVHRNMACLIKPLCTAGIAMSIQDNSGYTALHEAAKYGKVECVKALLEFNSSIFCRGGMHLEAALYCSAKGGFNNIAALLLHEGANPFLRNKNECSLVYFAASTNNLPLLTMITKNVVDAKALLLHFKEGAMHAFNNILNKYEQEFNIEASVLI